MSKIIEAADLPEQEKVYLKKDWLGWRVVEPPKKWWHYILGGKRNLFQVIIFLLFMGLLYYGVEDLISSYKTVAENPCKFCTDCHEQTQRVLTAAGYVDYELPEFNITFVEEGSKN